MVRQTFHISMTVTTISSHRARTEGWLQRQVSRAVLNNVNDQSDNKMEAAVNSIAVTENEKERAE